jgi:hypothetical protein
MALIAAYGVAGAHWFRPALTSPAHAGASGEAALGRGGSKPAVFSPPPRPKSTVFFDFLFALCFSEILLRAPTSHRLWLRPASPTAVSRTARALALMRAGGQWTALSPACAQSSSCRFLLFGSFRPTTTRCDVSPNRNRNPGPSPTRQPPPFAIILAILNHFLAMLRFLCAISALPVPLFMVNWYCTMVGQVE